MQQLKLAKEGHLHRPSASTPSAAAVAVKKKARKFMNLTIHGQGMRPEKFTVAGSCVCVPVYGWCVVVSVHTRHGWMDGSTPTPQNSSNPP